MTAADYGAVGPGVWDSWKAEIVADLYRRAMQYLAGETAYLESTAPPQVADDAELLRLLGPQDVIARGQYLPETHTVLFTVATNERIAPGIFHRLTGALTSHGLSILSAQINTLADDLVLDRFWASDPDYAGQPPPERMEQIQQALVESLRGPGAQKPSFRRTWQNGGLAAPHLTGAQTRVNIDNSTSDRYTVLDVFTHDRVGLLYAVTRRLFELGLSVGRAKIATHLDQVLDVFYVTDQAGEKITDPERLEDIRRRLLEVIEEP